MTLGQYLKKYWYIWIIGIVMTFICHGKMMLSSSIGIDTEIMLTIKDAFWTGWLGIGRYGLVLLKKMTAFLDFQPAAAGCITMVLLVCAGMLWCYLYYIVTTKENPFGMLGFLCILLSYTILAEQLYFKLQSAEVCFGFFVTALSLLFVFRAYQQKIMAEGVDVSTFYFV